jgi:alpha-amylase
LIEKLDYIENMGFDAVWISPVTENIVGNTTYGEAYHGYATRKWLNYALILVTRYWPSHLGSLNSHFGTPDDLTNLASALHGRNMYLMVDVVVNHLVSQPIAKAVSPSNVPAVNYTTITPFSSPTPYHTPCFITNYGNQTEVEKCWLGDAGLPLADLNTENQTVIDTMYRWIDNLVDTYQIDGLRIDTAKHIRKDFWPGFVESAGVFALAEVKSRLIRGNITV